MDLDTFSVIEATSAGSRHVLGHRKHPGSEYRSEKAAEELGAACLDQQCSVALLSRLSFGIGTVQQDATKRCCGSGPPQTLFTLSLQHICPFVVALGEAGA